MDQVLASQPQEVRNPVLPPGVHVLGDFYEVTAGSEEMLNAQALERFCVDAVARSGLTEVGRHFYQFDGAGVTGVVLLAESHIAIHTWPEKDYLTLDVFVCNVTGDNTGKARALYQSFVDLFQPRNVHHKEVLRD